jgi:hypothetical protein
MKESVQGQDTLSGAIGSGTQNKNGTANERK